MTWSGASSSQERSDSIFLGYQPLNIWRVLGYILSVQEKVLGFDRGTKTFPQSCCTRLLMPLELHLKGIFYPINICTENSFVTFRSTSWRQHNAHVRSPLCKWLTRFAFVIAPSFSEPLHVATGATRRFLDA